MAKEEGMDQPLVSSFDDSEEDIETATPVWEREKKTNKNETNRLHRYTALAAAFLAVSVVSLYVGTQIQVQGSRDSQCSKHTSQWSPILRDVGVTYSSQSFEGSFMDENIFRKAGSAEVDAAWEALGVDYRAGIISTEDGLKSGLDESFVQRAEKYGGGFIVNVEGLHHLHCLNLVRKALYFNYAYYKKLGMHAFKNDEHILRLHVTHCLDTIRQVLMCNADTGMLGQVWVYPNEPAAFPDFNTRHTCKNFDGIRKWASNTQAPPNDATPDDYLAPPIGMVKSAIP